MHRVNGAEPQVVGLASVTTEERKTDTMKTYILRNVKPVQPQKASRPRRVEPVLARVTKGPVLYIGLDVHNDTIAVSLAPSDTIEVRRYGIIGGEHADVLKLAKKLADAHPGTLLRFCYEAGPRGFALCRCPNRLRAFAGE